MTGSARGVLHPERLPTFHRLPAPDAVADLVRWFWIPEWDLPSGHTSRQELVAYPATNLVVEPHLVGLSGPTTRLSFRELTGRGWAVGALLRPAAVPGLVDDPGSARDRYVPLELPELHGRVADAMTAGQPLGRRERAVGVFSAWLHARIPTVTEEAHLVNDLADMVEADSDILRVEDLASRLGLSVRTVQRLARRYVGLPPAAMIRRRRLQEAAERIRTEPGVDLAAIAADLGYADQAHLTNDFRTVLGHTPGRYRDDSH
ncbi:MAG: helix-turn-helix domain-containing protein [Intrasporangium sp.]|uniref:AraC family transcriptional regulator n=1 Tax=Intrasporangium sp. TaxID=1925024 RepID=UPI00264899EB|nr:helix-turn-helix domain-containing protein [Intrasporangium sp.]MDN5795660.1 helix-turn-helix domain-containing protein [Intrasporangium sp.]